MAPFAGPPAMTFFAQLSAGISGRTVTRTVLPPIAAALAAMGTVLAISTLATAGGAERWALRPKAPSAPATATPEAVPATPPATALLRGVKSVPLSELPGERRTVRIVYQGYLPSDAR